AAGAGRRGRGRRGGRRVVRAVGRSWQSREEWTMIVPLTPLDYKRRAVRNFGDKIGVVDGDRRFTYREFGDRADRLAGALRALGLGPGDRVAFISYTTHHLLEAYRGVIQPRGLPTPINLRPSSHALP